MKGESWVSDTSQQILLHKKLYFYIGDLPATTEGYSIDIKYTTQVNPELINSLTIVNDKELLNFRVLK